MAPPAGHSSSSMRELSERSAAAQMALHMKVLLCDHLHAAQVNPK